MTGDSKEKKYLLSEQLFELGKLLSSLRYSIDAT